MERRPVDIHQETLYPSRNIYSSDGDDNDQEDFSTVEFVAQNATQDGVSHGENDPNRNQCN